MTHARIFNRSTLSLALCLPLALVAAVAAGPAGAASSASSASSDGASASVGSSSTSIEKSSASSTGDDKKVAAGDYRIVQIAALQAQPERLRVTLQALDGGEAFDLLLPQQAAQGRLAAGGVVTARARAYGMEFAAAVAGTSAPQAFFLVLDDRWHQELRTRAVTL